MKNCDIFSYHMYYFLYRSTTNLEPVWMYSSEGVKETQSLVLFSCKRKWEKRVCVCVFFALPHFLSWHTALLNSHSLIYCKNWEKANRQQNAVYGKEQTCVCQCVLQRVCACIGCVRWVCVLYCACAKAFFPVGHCTYQKQKAGPAERKSSSSKRWTGWVCVSSLHTHTNTQALGGRELHSLQESQCCVNFMQIILYMSEFWKIV